MSDAYYVYLHRKKDTNEIFYVGKGKNKRHLEESNRNQYWHNVVGKHGFISEFVIENVDEEFALLIEQELIDKYKKNNIRLVNLTNGGEGVSGLKHSPSVKKTLSEKALGRKHTDLTKQKIGMFWKNKKRGPFTEEHKENISIKRQKQIMKPVTDETKQKISFANKGKKRTEEQRKKISESTKMALKNKGA
jgi:hypothetical protein